MYDFFPKTPPLSQTLTIAFFDIAAEYLGHSTEKRRNL